jgi:hypothetical protein
MPKRYVTLGSGELSYKVAVRKSPKGKLYVGKTTMMNAEYANARAANLRQQGVKAWVEGRTVYNK